VVDVSSPPLEAAASLSSSSLLPPPPLPQVDLPPPTPLAAQQGTPPPATQVHVNAPRSTGKKRKGFGEDKRELKQATLNAFASKFF